MRIEEWFAALSADKEGEAGRIRQRIPLGMDVSENVAFARAEESAPVGGHTCVTGGGKSRFLRQTLFTLAHLYGRLEACFLVLSPFPEYGELLRVKKMELTCPYLRNKEDLRLVMETLQGLLSSRETGKKYPRLIVVADGIEEIEGCNRNGDLEEVRELIDLLSRREGVDVFTGVELTKSIFSGLPSAFVGVGNCLVATRELGKADVTYAQADGTLTLPTPMRYVDEPSLTETIVALNCMENRGTA